MPQRFFAIETNGPKSLKLEWKGIWKHIEVSFEDKALGIIENQEALKDGREFQLPNGSSVSIQLCDGIQPRLEILIDGVHAPGSPGDPRTILQNAAYVTYFIGGTSIILGTLGLANIPLFAEMGFGFISIIIGFVIADLGYHAKKSLSKIALLVAMAIFALDSVVSLMLVLAQGGEPPIVTLIIKVFLISQMYKGLDAIDQIKETPQKDTPS